MFWFSTVYTLDYVLQTIVKFPQVTQLYKCGEVVERVDAGMLGTQQRRCADIVYRFMELDIEQDDLVTFLSDFVIPTADKIMQIHTVICYVHYQRSS